MRAHALIGFMLWALIGCKTTEVSTASKDSDAIISPKSAKYQVEYVSQFQPVDADHLSVCTWNIQWVGHWKAKKNADIANVLRHCDVAVIQEIVTPPWDVTVVTDGNPATQKTITLKGDVESKAFVDAMKSVGFDGIELSPEDTGPTRNHINTTASEWYAIFFKSQKAEIAKNLPNGFLSAPLAANPVYSRVPYAFGIRARHNGKPSVDMVLISVHLHATGDNEPTRRCKARRIREFHFINQWITERKEQHVSQEKDYFVLGDMNIEDLEEVEAFMGQSPTWLKTETAKIEDETAFEVPENPAAQMNLRNVRSMNYLVDSKDMKGTNLKRDKAYDHVMHYTTTTLDLVPTLQIVDLTKTFHLESFPNANSFVQAYSDHNPLRFVITLGADRD